MEPSIDDPSEEFDNLSLNSTAAETKRSTTSSCSESVTCATPSLLQPSCSAKPHAPPCDPCWEAIRLATTDNYTPGIGDLRFLQRLGSGDIGSVYLVELKCAANGSLFAAKVMDKRELAARKKEGRSRIERGILDHPFLPTLYAALDSPRWSCLLTEFCPGGDLHVLRQRQPQKRFDDAAVRYCVYHELSALSHEASCSQSGSSCEETRMMKPSLHFLVEEQQGFYASEVIAALEYLHVMGIIYRDLKPENVLVRSDGHIMLTDFDLSLRNESLTSTAHVVHDQDVKSTDQSDEYRNGTSRFSTSSCMLPNCIAPAVSCFHPKRKRRNKSGHRKTGSPEIVAEPVDVRSTSFVGTLEYLAPEIISGEGHGNAVDWWTLGVLMYEMLYGTTPFRGTDHEMTLANVVARAVEFPKEPVVSGSAKDLIAQLLVKDPTRRMGATMGSTAVKHHPYFDGVNWALLRCTAPPYILRPVVVRDVAAGQDSPDNLIEYF